MRYSGVKFIDRKYNGGFWGLRRIGRRGKWGFIVWQVWIFSLGKWESSGDERWWWLHSHVNVLNATEPCTPKWLTPSFMENLVWRFPQNSHWRFGYRYTQKVKRWTKILGGNYLSVWFSFCVPSFFQAVVRESSLNSSQVYPPTK